MTENIPEPILTPAGRLRIREMEGADVPADAWTKRVLAAFSADSAAGLFALAATRPEAPPPPVFAFWRNFAGRYLTERCRTPDFVQGPIEPVPPPGEAELFQISLSAPPMAGGEYLDAEVLRGLWTDLDDWVRREIGESAEGPGGWLGKHAPACSDRSLASRNSSRGWRRGNGTATRPCGIWSGPTSSGGSRPTGASSPICRTRPR
jgi:hypothetical protein